MLGRKLHLISAATMAAAALFSGETKYNCDDNKHVHPVMSKPDVVSIIAGGGTAGCIAAYFQATWMKRAGVPGKVLLIDRGDNYNSSQGPSPKLRGIITL